MNVGLEEEEIARKNYITCFTGLNLSAPSLIKPRSFSPLLNLSPFLHTRKHFKTVSSTFWSPGQKVLWGQEKGKQVYFLTVMSHHILQGVRFVQVFRDLLVDQVVPKDGISEKMRGLCVLNIRILSCSSSQNYDNKRNLKTEHCLIDHTFGDDFFKFDLSRFDCFSRKCQFSLQNLPCKH